VTDDGIGISADNLPRLFQEFQQLDSGASKRYPGTGLGLVLTKRIVEAQGGSISVESTLGRGATFSATLPRRIRGGTPTVGGQ
jgi:protein-histidine pros-kinase